MEALHKVFHVGISANWHAHKNTSLIDHWPCQHWHSTVKDFYTHCQSLMLSSIDLLSQTEVPEKHDLEKNLNQ